MSNPILFIPSPRNIVAFEEATAKVKADKLWIKFYPEKEAYDIARDWFLDHSAYSHIAILPDDLLITSTDYNLLKHDADHYNVINGWCRNTIRLRPNWTGEPETEYTADTNVSITHLPPDPPSKGTYEQFHFASISQFNRLIAESINPVIEVKFAGFPLTFISREIVEQVPFRSDGCCVDSCFSLDIDKKGIKQFVDLRVRTTHMNRPASDLMVGKNEPSIIFESL
jgi:hypothetical protein